MAILSKTPAADPASLNQRVIAAREAYQTELAQVIEVAEARQRAIQEIVVDLSDERSALDGVVINAQK